MKANPNNYNLKQAKDLKEVFKHLSNKKDNWKIFAGGTDLMVLFELGNLAPGNYISVFGVKELSQIQLKKDQIEIGAATTFRTIAENPTIIKEFPLLVQAAANVGAIAIQNRATIGGNIANASPAADTPPALMCYDAILEISNGKSSRLVELKDFYLDYKKYDLQNGEIITKVILPRSNKRNIGIYQKVGPRKAMAISKVVMCANAKTKKGVIEEIRFALGSVAPITKRLVKLEEYLAGKKIDQEVIATTLSILSQEISPISDIRSTDQYRRKVAENLIIDFLHKIN